MSSWKFGPEQIKSDIDEISKSFSVNFKKTIQFVMLFIFTKDLIELRHYLGIVYKRVIKVVLLGNKQGIDKIQTKELFIQ